MGFIASPVICGRMLARCRPAPWRLDVSTRAASVTAHRACDDFAQFAEPRYTMFDRISALLVGQECEEALGET